MPHCVNPSPRMTTSYTEGRAQHHRCHRTQVAGYGRLGTGRNRQDVWVETPDGTKNDRCFSGAKPFR